MANPFVWVELHTPDPEKSKSFYQKLFAWHLKEVPLGPGATYTMIDVGEGTGGGVMHSPDTPSRWLAYVLVDDVGTATKAAEALGGKVVHGRTEVPGFGWLSVIADPGGAVLGLWQRKS